uniref:Abscisic acid receptor n=1 Tax=Tamarix hispida TaxID=189793 RepID=A0A9E8DF11_9CARY|nr:abscisic acid receptor [Tamarix hispida]
MPSAVHFHHHQSTPAAYSVHHKPHHHQQQQINSLLEELTRRLSPIPETIYTHHSHRVGPNQCSSAVIQHISAPISTVWSLVRRFDNPQAYKHFLKSCEVLVGDGDVGTLRQVRVISGLPAAFSTERLEILDDERHVMSFSVVGGEHRLKNYRSVTTLHPTSSCSDGSGSGTVVVESYVVDVPTGNTKEETCVFVDTIVKCNLQSLAQIAEKMSSTHSCKVS